MNPQDLPLEPLIAPTAVSWWPLAPIWWIALTIIILIAVIVFAYIKSKKTPKAKPMAQQMSATRRSAALAELALLSKPYNQPAGPWLQQLNTLLKRICYKQYPTIDTHTLLGTAWLAFLNDHCPEAKLDQYPMLVDGLYQDDYYLENNTIDTLNTAIETWINQHV